MLFPADSQWMARALQLAERGLYTTSPNPRVGCVLVKDGQVIGEGWHERAGEAHAEVHALRASGNVAHGATAYVTLEPCSHHGRTPPCAEALIAAGISRVVVAVQDPNPLVAGLGIAKLRGAGIQVECGLMEMAARELNIGFFSRMTRGMPWVRSKIAASLDGRTALANGTSQWITGEAARRDVQHWRARSCAVLTGIGTVLADDPQLNVRIENERQPLRVVLDSELRISPNAKILQGGGALIYTASTDANKHAALQAHGAEVVLIEKEFSGQAHIVGASLLANSFRQQAGSYNSEETNGQVDLLAVMHDLAQRGINEVLVEAGRTLNGALIKAGLVDELVLYLAPQMLGDMARGMASLGELTQLEQRVDLVWQDVRHVGNDLRISARINQKTAVDHAETRRTRGNSKRDD